MLPEVLDLSLFFFLFSFLLSISKCQKETMGLDG